MKLASYKGTQHGVQGIINRLIRWRFDGIYSHTEIVFEPDDGVDLYMPDGICGSNDSGALWCASSTAIERLPAWSNYRAGKMGGVRLKRIVLDPAKWDIEAVNADPLYAIRVYNLHEGQAYSWRHIAKFMAWWVSLNGSRSRTCAQLAAEMLSFDDGWRFDPSLLAGVTHRVTQLSARSLD